MPVVVGLLQPVVGLRVLVVGILQLAFERLLPLQLAEPLAIAPEWAPGLEGADNMVAAPAGLLVEAEPV